MLGVRSAFQLATWFGCGNSPVAPGTVGSIGAVPLHLLLRSFHPAAHLAVVAGLSALGIWSSNEVARELDEEDPQSVVIDEVAGALIAMGLVRSAGFPAQLAALALFRAFDIVKPGPIARAEKMQPPGLGIMLDDLAAGVIAGLVTRWAR